MKRILIFSLSCLAGLTISCTKNSRTGGGNGEDNDPSRVTITCSVSEITSSSAKVKCVADISVDKLSSSKFGVQYALDLKMSSQLKSIPISEFNSADKSFETVLSGLTPGTYYYCRAYLEDADGNVTYSKTAPFETTPSVDMAVSTLPASDVYRTSATLNGRIDEIGFPDLPPMFFKYGTSETSLDNNAQATMNPDNESFYASLGSLQPSTKYYYRAFCTVNDIEIAGEILFFETTTIGLTVSTQSAMHISSTSVTLSGLVDVEGTPSDAMKAYFKWGSSESLDNEDAATLASDGRSFSVFLGSLSPATTYYYKAFCEVGSVENAGEILSFTTFSETEIPTEPNPKEKVPEAVDLGLPSGLKWASWNLGAQKPEDYGDYYAWGATEPWYTDGNAQSLEDTIWKSGYEAGYDWTTCPYRASGDNYSTLKFSKYVPSAEESSYWGGSGSADDKTILELKDDAARARLGGSWRMPTIDEFNELIDNTTQTWTTTNGINGYVVKSKVNDKSIFIPVSGCRFQQNWNDDGINGYYWSSSLYPYPYSARIIYISSEIFSTKGYQFERHAGLSVRPVQDN